MWKESEFAKCIISSMVLQVLTNWLYNITKKVRSYSLIKWLAMFNSMKQKDFFPFLSLSSYSKDVSIPMPGFQKNSCTC
jgi:hypothetical protein